MVFQALKSKLNDIRVAALFLVVSLMLICACIWAYHEFMTTPPYVDPERYPVRGIDISAHNGMMNLDAAAKDGIDFVFIKASEGETFRDDNFRLNYRKAEHAGLKIGVYHFFRFDKDGVSQAINLLRTVGSRKPELGLAIDVEKQGNPANVPDSLVKDRLSSMETNLISSTEPIGPTRNLRRMTRRSAERDLAYPTFLSPHILTDLPFSFITQQQSNHYDAIRRTFIHIQTYTSAQADGAIHLRDHDCMPAWRSHRNAICPCPCA